MARAINMTEGRPLTLLVRFALPMMATSVLQLLYTVADSAVVGRLLGVEAFAAVGAAGFFYWMIISIILGFSQGFGAIMAQRFGASDMAGLRKSLAASYTLCLIIGGALTIATLFLTRPVLALLQTPPEIIDDTALYLYCVFAGLLISFGFNVVASAFRAVGDAKTLLVALGVSSVLNIVLDILLVLYTPLGVAAVAIATVVAQLFSLVICLLRLHRFPFLRLGREDWHALGESLRELMRMGAPMGFRNCIIALGGVVTQYYVNGFGTIFVAGIAAPKKLYGFLEIISYSMDGAIATFVAQNYGARNMERIKEGVTSARRIMLVSSVLISIIMFFVGRQVLSLFVTGDAAQVEAMLDIAVRQLGFMLAFLPFVYMLYLYRSSLLSLGNSFYPMLAGFVEMGLRIAVVLILPRFFGEWGVYPAEIIGWPVVSIMMIVTYRREYAKKTSAA